MGALAMEVMGSSAVDLTDLQVDGQIHSVSLTIAAGTSQIQRNIVGERILGLPKER
jgi:alkylation response protein AidB-like acyl-CoA dehydrogenase